MTIDFALSPRHLSNLGGLVVPAKVIDLAGIKDTVEPALPRLEYGGTARSWNKFRTMMLGAMAGTDCLTDIERLRDDPVFSRLTDHVNSSTAYGQFVRDFSPVQIRLLNSALVELGHRLRSICQPKAKEFIIDIDSSEHEHFGKKKEGVDYNYQNRRALQSIEAFDQFGFQYWMDVRPGGTHTSAGVSEIVSAIFHKAPPVKAMKRYLRADSGYCNVDFFRAAIAACTQFVTPMRQNMLKPLLGTIDNWRTTKVRFYDGREAEIGWTVYRPKGLEAVLRVVVIRAKREEEDGVKLFEEYDYRGWVSNIGQHEMRADKLIRFYAKRGHAENFIRELKNGFELRRFPSQKLIGNRAYALISAFAYNCMRLCSFVAEPKKCHFAKNLRRRMVFRAVEVVAHARKVTFRFSETTLKEVRHWITTLRHIFSPAQAVPRPPGF